jgi:hypothetical protein
MSVALGQLVTFAVGHENSEGLPSNASSFVGTLYRNGASTGEAVTETNLATGLYSIAFTVPPGWTAGDLLQMRVVADGIGRFVWGAAVATAVELDSSARQKLTDIKAVTDKINSGLVQDGLVYQFTANMLELGPSGGGGGNNQEILSAIDGVAASVAAYAARLALEVSLTGFPSVICRNADYVEETESEIRLTIEDLTGAAITEIAGTPVASLTWLLGMGTEQQPNLIDGTCAWDADTDELVIEIPKESTATIGTGTLTWQVGVTVSTKTRWLGGGTTRLIERQF